MLSYTNGYFLGNNSSYIGVEHDQNIDFWFYYDCYLRGYLKIYLNIWILKKKKMGWWANLLNPPTPDGLSQITKFLANQKVSRVGFTHFQPDSWWANPCESGWLTLTCLLNIGKHNKKRKEKKTNIKAERKMKGSERRQILFIVIIIDVLKKV